jgi:hypothetical protein
MGNALVHPEMHEAALPPSVQETALRMVLEEARQLAAQSRLLALNAAIESAGACREAGAAQDGAALAASAERALAETDRLAGAVESFLQQIRAASALS